MKSLGFVIKPNDYQKIDWSWLIAKVEKKINVWCHHQLSREGRLVLVKFVLEAIHVYWMSLSWTPKGVLEVIRRISFKFI
jgi:hypothetical protein